MNTKRAIGMFLGLAIMVLLALAARAAFSPAAVAEAPKAAPPLAPPAAAEEAQRASSAAAVLADVSETIAGAIVEQTFTLNAGWNAIYLEVEPINGSPLGKDGVPTLSVIEYVFNGLTTAGALDSVWTYNQPVSNRDYLIDPGDGLWDEPGWLRYVPDSNVGPDGESRGFLTNLYTLHANTGYLVKMNEAGEIKVTGKPVPGHHRWTPGAYNLTGFPLMAPGIALSVYATGSPITEVRGLTASGSWTAPLAAGDLLMPGVAYLVKYASEPADADFTAPLDVGLSAEAMILPTEGLKFEGGLYANTAALRLENLSTTPCDAVVLSVPADSSVALQYVSDVEPPEAPVDLRGAGKSIPLAAHEVAWATLQVPVEQLADGATVLQIACTAVGTRWLIPVEAKSRSLSGLWVGDVVVNDVSEARLGATDANHDLTVALASQNSSGVRGAAEIHEELVGASSTLQIAITLALPEETAAVLPRILALSLLSSPTQETWTPVEGSLAGGFVMGLDGTSNNQYLNVDDVVVNKTLTDGLHPFRLSTAGLPAGFYTYWAAKGVTSSAAPDTWEARMWQIIIGNEPIFYLKVSGSGANFRLLDGLSWDFFATEEYLRVPGDYPTGEYSYGGILTDTEGRASGMSVKMSFVQLPRIVSLNLVSSTDKAAWTGVPGDLAGGYSMGLNPATEFYYMNVPSLEANATLKDGLHPFVLDVTTLPPGFYEYWAELGVKEGATGSLGTMWEIIVGTQPIFYLKVDAATTSPYRLLDGMTYLTGGGEEYWRVNGSLPLGPYHFKGTITDTEGRTGKLAVAMTFEAALTAASEWDETAAAAAAPEQIEAAILHVAGYVFVDANQNGQRDADEPGLIGVPVTLAGFGTQTTAADGGYLFNAVPAGTYTIEIATPPGYTSEFDVVVPADELDGTPVAVTNAVPASVTLGVNQGATAVTPEKYLAQILPKPADYPYTPYLPYFDSYDNRVEPPLNFGLVRADTAYLLDGQCGDTIPEPLPAELGIVKNGKLVTSVPGPLADLLGNAYIYLERKGAGVACGNLVIGAPTEFADGRGSSARFRILLRVNASGQTELLPYYKMDDQQRVSAANFLSLQKPKVIAGPFGDVAQELEFDLSLPASDPLNPFKHKYSPDHDNLDRKFQEYEETVPLYLYESYAVNRKVTLNLTELPPDQDAAAAAELDWGGAMWGGDYREVLEGLHQNTITVRGYFVIRRALSTDQLVAQDYDK